MNTFLWVLQSILALVFLGSGIAKSFMSKERMLATGQTGAAALPLSLVRFVAFCEILGSFGLILPQAFSIAPLLTPFAAGGLGIIMVGAAIVHYRIREVKPIAINGVLLAMCIIIACERR